MNHKAINRGIFSKIGPLPKTLQGIGNSEMNNLTVSKKLFQEDEYTTGVELALDGELLYEDAQDFMREIVEMSKGCGKKVVLDMGRMRYIDSSGLGAILYVSEALRMQGQKLYICKATKNNVRVLKTINKVGTFVLEDTTDH